MSQNTCGSHYPQYNRGASYRTPHQPYFPYYPDQTSLVDQYMWPIKDSAQRMAVNGVARPIYNSQGNISYTLPLEHYAAGRIHPEVVKMNAMMRRPKGQ